METGGAVAGLSGAAITVAFGKESVMFSAAAKLMLTGMVLDASAWSQITHETVAIEPQCVKALIATSPCHNELLVIFGGMTTKEESVETTESSDASMLCHFKSENCTAARMTPLSPSKFMSWRAVKAAVNADV